MNKLNNQISRIVLKVPKTVADYFRKTFPHGQRAKFFMNCVLEYKRNEHIHEMENKLHKVGKKRQ